MTPYERIDHAIDAASEGLRALSLDIHAHPELNFEEHHAHQVLTDYLDAEGFGVLFRVEAFPLWSQGGVWRDAGVYTDFGIGGMKLKSGGDTEADGGALSIIGLGAFWEPVRFSIFSFGPNIEYVHAYSRTLHLSSATVGARLVLYTRP